MIPGWPIINMISLATFASDDMSRSAELCVSSGLAQGAERDFYITWDQFTHVPTYQQNRPLFDQPRGKGFWAWKPYAIREAMLFAKDGDVLIWADAGVEFIEPVQTVIDRMDQDIFLFGNEHEHAHWCKRDIVEAVWPLCFEPGRLAESITAETPKPPFMELPNLVSTPWSRFSKQVQASVIFFRVNDYTRKFVKEWLDWCLFEGGRLIDDSPSRTPNHPEFRENRHDQSILTTMAYREGFKLHGWFVRYETYTPGRSPYYSDDYPPLFLHHRKRNHEWSNAA